MGTLACAVLWAVMAEPGRETEGCSAAQASPGVTALPSGCSSCP